MKREEAFLAALAETTRYLLDGSSLVFLDEQGVVARLVATEPTSFPS